MTGNDRPGRACAAQSEDDMVNKVRVTIAGAPYAIATTDTENYITTLAKKLDDDITKLLDNNANLSVTKAAVFCAMDYLDEYRKSAGSAENMRSQIQDYISDAARAKLAADKVRRRTRPSSGKMPLCGNSWPSCSRSDLHYINVKGSTMSKSEILAPVGSEEMLRAAEIGRASCRERV